MKAFLGVVECRVEAHPELKGAIPGGHPEAIKSVPGVTWIKSHPGAI
jgi:hypothetical protein